MEYLGTTTEDGEILLWWNDDNGSTHITVTDSEDVDPLEEIRHAIKILQGE